MKVNIEEKKKKTGKSKTVQHQNIKTRVCQKTAIALISAVLCQTAFLPVLAAEPTVSVDETMYVNLDPYGHQETVNVVKGVTTNGVKQFTDYGNYSKVINMSSHVEPAQSNGQLHWDLSELGARFYYQGTMDASKVELPWTFDVSYKFNGKEAKAEELAGVSGLIEVHVEAEPNDKAADYYQNNMMLAVMIPVDMDSCYSVDAPGSQMQTMGETTGVVFTALPGEKGDFTARIGTDSYESIGVIMMMLPGTTSSLEHIKDVKEVKDTWRQAGTDMYNSIDAMLASMESMRSGVQTVQNSLYSLEAARRTFSTNRPAIEAQNDISIEALASLAEQSAAMVPYLQIAKNSAEDINTNMNALVKTLGSMQLPLQDLDEHLDTIQDGVSRTEDNLPGLESALMQVITLDTQLQAQQATILMTLAGLSQSSMEGDIDKDADYFADEQALAYANAMMAASGLDKNDPQQAELYEQKWQEIYEAAFKKYYNGYKDNALGQLQAAVSGIENPKNNLLKKVDALQTLASRSNSLSKSAQTLLKGTDKSIDSIREMMAEADNLIDDVRDLQETMNLYYPSLQDALTDSQELLNRANNGLNQAVASMTIIQNTLKASTPHLDEGSRQLLEGSQNLLDKSLHVLDSTGEIRKSSGVMKTTLDDELDKFEEENRFLEMDPDAPMLSLTSGKNPEPHSLQIILRTTEISLDDEEAGSDVVDLETEEAPSNPFVRMWRVLVDMWNAAMGVFRNR
jgi:methyl-accepting chemotaxis protein